MDVYKSGEFDFTGPDAEIESGEGGILYIVSTPIGNLEDITIRAIKILKGVGLIAAENVQHSRILCRHYGIGTRLTSYNQHNERVKGPELVRRLKSGRSLAYISSAGTPGISDPGSALIRRAFSEGIRVSPVPGPSALTAAVSVSGFPSDRFLFAGFLSSKKGKRRKELKGLESIPHAMVFFESPHRLRAFLEDIREILGDREMVVVREATKLFEEVRRGRASEILEGEEPEKIKGEFTIVVAGGVKEEGEIPFDKDIGPRIEILLRKGDKSVRDIAARLSREEGLSYRDIYRKCLDIKRKIRSS